LSFVVGQAGAAARVARSLMVAILVTAVFWDLRSRRIPNALTLTCAVAGLVAAAVGLGSPGGAGTAALAALVGLLLWLPFYVLGVLGAGDVKLFAAASTWLTPMGSVRAALAAALFGGVLSIVWMVYARGGAFTAMRLGHAMQQPRVLTEAMPTARGTDGRVPYGVALVAGLLYEAWRLYRGA
jgi:prepilin peptidase CpaA